jgi:hypothetical protein
MMRLLPLAFFLVSCSASRYVYSPAVSVNPYFKNKGDSKLTATYSTGGNDNKGCCGTNRGLDIQSAYAFAPKWAATLDHFYRREKDVYKQGSYNLFDSSIASYKRTMTSVGIGFFSAINRRKTVTFNLYGGVGFGSFRINDEGENSIYNYGVTNLTP